MSDQDSTLIKKQTEGYNPEVAEYIFETEMEGAEPVTSGSLKALKPGIDLHFYRYGLFPNRDKDNSEKRHLFYDQNGEIDEQPDVLHPEGAPEVEGFFYGRTALTDGYLYIIDAVETGDFWEYKLDDVGNIFPVVWKSMNADIRESSSRSINKITFKQDTELWVAYSPVQWSSGYHELMRSNETRRSERMIKIKCTGFKEGEEGTSDVLPFDKMFTTYNPFENYQSIWFNDKMKESIADFNADKGKDPEAIKEDMHITLHSPLGCALDLNYHLGLKNIDFRALVENIQTGQDIEVIKQKLLSGDVDIPVVSNEHQSLFSLALACYQIVYSARDITKKYDGGKPGINWLDTYFPREYEQQKIRDEKIRQEVLKGTRNGTSRSGWYAKGQEIAAKQQAMPNRIIPGFIGHGLDREKVEGILGVSDRQKLRDEVLGLRKTLAKYIRNKYCKKILDDYLHNIEAYKLEGMAGLAIIFENLFVSPYDVDNHLLLAQNRKKEDDIKKWIYDLIDDKSAHPDVVQTDIKSQAPGYQNMDPLHALMSAELNMEYTWENRFGTEVKLAGFLNGILGFMTKKAFDLKVIDGKNLRTLKEVKEFVVNKLQTKYKYKGSPIYLLRRSEMYMQLDAFGVTGEQLKSYVRVAPYQGRHDWLRIYQDSPEVHVEIDGNNKMITMPLEYDVEVSQRDVQLNKLNQKAAKILNGKSFTTGMAGLQMINMYKAIAEFDKEKDSKSIVNTAGVTADLTEAILNVQKARLSARGLVTRARNVGTWAGRFGAIGGFATSTMCIWDSVEAFNKSDIDAGVAWAGAGVAYGVSTVMASFCSGMALAGPIGLIAAGVGLGLVVLANVLTDTDLEYYFKHFLLSDRVAYNKDALVLPGVYARQILEKRNELMGNKPKQKDKDTIMNPYDAQVRLWDLMVCTQMLFEPVDSKRTIYTSYSTIGTTSSSTVKYYSFDVTMEFMKFLDIDSDIQTHALLYANGFKNGNPQNISSQRAYDIRTDDKSKNILKIRLVIPTAYRSQVSELSDIIFAVRINFNNNEKITFPFIYKNKERYLGAKADLGTLVPIFGTKQNEEIRIGSMADLKTKEIWG